jgi:hypothetical protein
MRQQSPSRLTRAVLLLGLLPLAGCGGTQSQVAPPEATVAATEAAPEASPTVASLAPAAPRLSATGSGVSVAVAGAESRTLADGEAVDLADGASVAVDAPSRAALSWMDAQEKPLLTGDVLGGGSLTVQAVDAVAGTASLTQDSGTARYTVGRSATVRVTAGQLLASAAEPESSFVLSVAAKAASPLWVAVDKGSVSLGKPAPVASSNAASASGDLLLKAGQAAAFDGSGKLLGQVDLTADKLGTWFEGVAAGKSVGTMAKLPVAKAAAAQPVPVSQPAAVPAAGASFVAEATVVDAGGCTTLRWSAPDALFVSLDGNDVPNTGSQQVCLSEPRNFKLNWVGKDGKEQSTYLAIALRAASTDGNKDEDDDDEDKVQAPPPPDPEPTECVGPECEVPGPPSVEEPGVGAEPGPADPAPAEPAPAEPAPAEPGPPDPPPAP